MHRIIFILLILTGSNCLSQNSTKVGDVHVKEYSKNANSCYLHAAYDSTIFYFEKISDTEYLTMEAATYFECKTRLIDSYIKNGLFEKARIELNKANKLILGQKNPDTHNALLLTYLYGEYYSRIGASDQAQKYYSRGLENLQSSALKNDSLHVLFLKGLGNIDLMKRQPSLALGLYQRARALEMSRVKFPNLMLGSLNLNIALAYSQLEEIDSAGYYFSSSIDAFSKIPHNKSPLARAYLNYSIYFLNFGKLSAALQYCKKADSLYHLLPNNNQYKLANLYSNYASIYLLTNDYQLALDYFLKSESIYLEYSPANHRVFENLDINIALLYKSMAKYEESIQRYNSKYIANSMDPNTRVIRLRNIGDCYLRLGNQAEAGTYFQKALNYALQVFGKDHLQTASCYLSNANYYSAVEDWPQMEHALDYALSFFITYYGLHNWNVTHVYNTWCTNYIKMGKFEKAAQKAQQALISLIPDFKDTSIFTNPADGQLPDNYQAIATLTLKAKALAQLMNKYPAQKEFAASTLETARLGIRLFETFQFSLGEEISKLYTSEKTNKLFQYGLEAAWQQYENSGEQKFRDIAFELTQKNKATILVAGMDTKSIHLNNYIPDSLIKKEQSLKQELRNFAGIIHQERKKLHMDSLKIVWMQNQLFDARIALDSLMGFFSQKYPRYNELKNTKQVKSIPDLQLHLSNKEVLIEYAMADNFLFIFAISADHVVSERVEIGSAFNDHLRSFLKLLGHPPSFDTDPELLIKNYMQLSNGLYQVLIQPVESFINKKELIIIPDDMLDYLPFETLSVSAYNDSIQSFRDIPYFLKEHAISYHYSSTLFSMSVSRPGDKYPTKALVMAPIYRPQSRTGDSSIYDHLAYLKYTRDEAEQVHQMMGGKLYLDSLATEGNFKMQAPDYSIIHLAMHTRMDDDNPMSSQFIFSKSGDTLEDGLLNTYEIYDLNLHADLVVLSACETGTGKLRRGEGLMSMARGFLFAGVPSLLITHWKVSDEQSTRVMEGFYKHLEIGKRLALQQSKVDYLKHAGQIFSYPYYWSGYILIGDDRGISKSNTSNSYYFFIIGIFTIVIAWRIFRRRNKT